jgi:G3E family GTPase
MLALWSARPRRQSCLARKRGKPVKWPRIGRNCSRQFTDRLFPSAEPAPFGRRLGRARGARIPIVLVTGFLGAGKTTLIQNILQSPQGASTAVIVNEFGDVGIDNAILRSASENIVLLGNGCLCCSMRSDLEETLAELLAQAATGAVPGFDRVIVETSGLADPGPILQTFVADRGIGREFHLETVITVVDAPSIEINLDRMVEAERQVVMADRILVSKTDLVEADTMARVKRLLAKRNPFAEIWSVPAVQLDLSALIQAPPHPRADIPGPVRHSKGIGCFTIFLDEPIDWPVFTHVLDVLMDLRGPDLLRVKGLLATREHDGPLVVHAVRHVLHPPVELLAWPDDDRRSRLVFIARNLAREQVWALFQSIQDVRPSTSEP